MLPVYFLLDPYHSSFEERFDMCRYHVYGKLAVSMIFNKQGEQLTLKDMISSLVAAEIRAL